MSDSHHYRPLSAVSGTTVEQRYHESQYYEQTQPAPRSHNGFNPQPYYAAVYPTSVPDHSYSSYPNAYQPHTPSQRAHDSFARPPAHVGPPPHNGLRMPPSNDNHLGPPPRQYQQHADERGSHHSRQTGAHPNEFDEIGRPYRTIVGALTSGGMPSRSSINNMLSSAFDGLRLLDPVQANKVQMEGTITSEMIRNRKTRPRVQSMQLPPQRALRPSTPEPPDEPYEVSRPIWDEESRRMKVEEEKGRQDIKRRRRDGQACQGCQTVQTPEWRRGPMGARTLCNACGLVYAKLSNKQKQFNIARMQGVTLTPAALFADEANEGWGTYIPQSPNEALALIQRVRKSVVGGGHPRKAKDGSGGSGGSGTPPGGSSSGSGRSAMGRD